MFLWNISWNGVSPLWVWLNQKDYDYMVLFLLSFCTADCGYVLRLLSIGVECNIHVCYICMYGIYIYIYISDSFSKLGTPKMDSWWLKLSDTGWLKPLDCNCLIFNVCKGSNRMRWQPQLRKLASVGPKIAARALTKAHIAAFPHSNWEEWSAFIYSYTSSFLWCGLLRTYYALNQMVDSHAIKQSGGIQLLDRHACLVHEQPSLPHLFHHHCSKWPPADSMIPFWWFSWFQWVVNGCWWLRIDWCLPIRRLLATYDIWTVLWYILKQDYPFNSPSMVCLPLKMWNHISQYQAPSVAGALHWWRNKNLWWSNKHLCGSLLNGRLQCSQLMDCNQPCETRTKSV